ncbi:hypothetical protein BJ170DRAFT_290776 [Xylariales sp. AK1849]|nr:hypothetical protein BJ170DRAFT_290776 [Xylariales sp. AK1849]
MSMTYNDCPGDASLLATCVCQKNQNSLAVSQEINSWVRYSCSSHTADVASAQAVFAAYCGLNNGTSSFPVTSNPPGDMTYYITALAEYSSLAPCAQYGLSYGVFSQTYDYCPGGPQALASCACLKEGMPTRVSNVITSNVKYSCSSTASEDVSSVLSVWDLYCSAAKGLATPAGVTESVGQTSATAGTGSGSGISGPTATSSGGSGSGSSSGSSGSGSSGSSGSGGSGGSISGTSGGKSNTAAIAGAVVGVVLGLALLVGIGFFWRRHRRAQRTTRNQSTVMGSNAGEGNGKSELDSTAAAAAATVSPSPSNSKHNAPPRTDNVSPVSTHHTGKYPPHSELQGQYAFPPPLPQHPELQGQNAYSPRAQHPQQNESAGQHAYPQHPSPASEAHGQQIYEAPGQPRPHMNEAHGRPVPPPQAWQSGPVASYHEMDGGWNGQGGYQARQ